ncbi:MAG: winged helix DNA-binding protein [Rhizobium sp.]
MSRETPHNDEEGEYATARLADLIGYQLRRASIFDLQGATAALEPVQARPVPFSILLSIVENPGTTSAEICRTLGMKSANIVSILAEFEERGLFLRDADASDQRIQRLFPTRKGEAAAREGLARIIEHENKLLSRLNGSERAELLRLLARLWQPDEPS